VLIYFCYHKVPSQPPTDVSAMALTSQSLFVVWSPPPSSTIHGVLQGYRVLYRSVRDDEGKCQALKLLKFFSVLTENPHSTVLEIALRFERTPYCRNNMIKLCSGGFVNSYTLDV
jgi:Fibronectin type III domain